LRRLEPLAELGGESPAVDQAGQRVGLRQAQRQLALSLQLRNPREEINDTVGGLGHAREGPLGIPERQSRTDAANVPLSDIPNRTYAAAGSRAGTSIWFSHLATTAAATELPTTLVAERPMSSRWSTARISRRPASGRLK